MMNLMIRQEAPYMSSQDIIIKQFEDDHNDNDKARSSIYVVAVHNRQTDISADDDNENHNEYVVIDFLVHVVDQRLRKSTI